MCQDGAFRENGSDVTSGAIRLARAYTKETMSLFAAITAGRTGISVLLHEILACRSQQET